MNERLEADVAIRPMEVADVAVPERGTGSIDRGGLQKHEQLWRE